MAAASVRLQICHINGQIFQDSDVKICVKPLYFHLLANSLLPQKQTSIYGDSNLPIKSKKRAEQEGKSNEIRSYPIYFKPATCRLQTTAHSDPTPS